MRRLALLALPLLALLALAPLARAHDMGAMRVDLRPGAGRCDIEVLADLEHVPSPLRSDFAAALTAASALRIDGVAIPLPPPLASDQSDEHPANKIRIRYSVPLPAHAATIGWSSTLRVPEYYLVVHTSATASAGTSPSEQSQWLSGGETSRVFSLTTAAPAVAWPTLLSRYIHLGFTHIIPEGFDHILFVLGLCLLATNTRQLLAQITAFTLAHSITLALSITGAFSLPSSIVEPLIAASIAYVAIENLFVTKLHRARVAVVFAFGLFHGLGFAGVLQEVGIPREQLWTALLGFNLGVELGQLSVVALAFLAVGLWCRRATWYRARVAIPASACIALFALGLTAERVFLS
ncbi:MAG: HupE/UreJ family protein [Phycisphaerales bacterium]|nr:HupE/UreJ family protein [Phycisphaerales bacterium]